MEYTEKEIIEIIKDCEHELDGFMRFRNENCVKILKVVDQLVKSKLCEVNRSNRKDTIHNFLEITNKIIENTKVFDTNQTYTELGELPTVIANKYEIIKKQVITY